MPFSTELKIVALALLMPLFFSGTPQYALANDSAAQVVLHTTSVPAIKQGYVDAQDGQIHYWQAGSGEHTLLLIHQASSSGEEYAGMVATLAPHMKVVAYDWPGHGGSDDPPTEYGVPEFAEAGLVVLDHLGINKVNVLGNHGGALVAMHLAWQHPQRFNHLILAGTSGVKPPEEVQKFSDSLDLDRRNTTDLDGVSLDAAWQRFRGYMPKSPAAEILRPYVSSVVRRIRPYEAHHSVLRYDRRPALDAVKLKPILLTQGADDPFVDRQETLLARLPNARRVVLKDAGVFMFYERPDASANLVLEYLLPAARKE